MQSGISSCSESSFPCACLPSEQSSISFRADAREVLSKGVQKHALNDTVVQLFRLFCDKQKSLPWLRQCQEFSRYFPVQEEAMGFGKKKMPNGSLREFTDGRMEHSAGSVNG